MAKITGYLTASAFLPDHRAASSLRLAAAHHPSVLLCVPDMMRESRRMWISGKN